MPNYTADYERSFALVMEDEGFRIWTNTPGDQGGETYSGISKVSWPNLPIWAKIEPLKKAAGITASSTGPIKLVGGADLDADVKQFYWDEFWVKAGCDRIADKWIGRKLFNMVVNLGVYGSSKEPQFKPGGVRILQRALNRLNVAGTLFPNMVDDGRFGDTTQKAIGLAIQRWGGLMLWSAMAIQLGIHYFGYFDRDEMREKFAGLIPRAFSCPYGQA
jgi:lysozyme family protein